MGSVDYLETIDVSGDEGIIKNIISYGNGDNPSEGQEVIAHYTGTLLDGTKFDSSLDRNEPFKFQLGIGQVIKAWDLGFATMKKGEKAMIIAKSEYAYGKNGSPPTIPPDATLQFEVELLDFFDKPKSISEMTNEERYNISLSLKEEANQLVVEKVYDMANEKYLNALEHIKPNITSNDLENKDTKLLLSIYLNLSLTSNKNKNYKSSINYAEEALLIDNTNVKALFRKSTSEKDSNNFNDSLDTLNKILELDKENCYAKKLLAYVKKNIVKDRERQRTLFSKLF